MILHEEQEERIIGARLAEAAAEAADDRRVGHLPCRAIVDITEVRGQREGMARWGFPYVSGS